MRRFRHYMDTQTVVFLVLVAATLLTWLLGVESATSHALAGVAALTVGFVKLRLVGLHFMELGNAPALLRGIFEAYVVLTFTTLLVLYVAL